MKKKLKRTLYLIPTFYFILAVFFFYQHFSQRIPFSQVIGNIELTAKSTKATSVNPSEIKKLNIYANGMTFRFNSSHILSIKTADNIVHKSKIIDFTSKEDKFILHFENNINLIVASNSSDNKISINAELPKTVPPIVELSLPYFEDRGFSIGYMEEDNTPVISNGETNFFLALTNDYQLDNHRKRININVANNNSVSFMIQETLVGKGRTAEKWYEQNGSMDVSDYNSSVSSYVQTAFFGWNSRFNSKTGMWADEEGNQQFNEDTATAYLSESLQKGSYKTASKLLGTASVIQDKLTAQTATYLGNVVVHGKNFIQSQLSEKRVITTMLYNKNREILSKKDIINFMLNNKMEDSINNLVIMAKQSNMDETLAKTLDRLSTLIDANSYNSEIKIDSSIIEIIEERILPSVSWLDEGLFLEEENRTSVEESFKAGNLLLKSGSLLKNDFYISIGRQMIISILDRASESSFVPKTIYAKDNKISNQEGSLPPELFYFDLTDNPFYSVQNNLIDTLGSGSWIYTSAKQFEIQANSKETHITVNFPKGSIHHFAIKGVKPFKKLIMWGLEWRTAPDFQRYDAGWVYDKTNETLYIKLQHRAEIEKIRILYYDPKTAENSGTSD